MLMFELTFVEYFFQNGASILVFNADIEIISREMNWKKEECVLNWGEKNPPFFFPNIL